MAFKFTSDNFDKEVLNSELPVLVDFYADWCGPCKIVGPIIDELATEYEGRAKIGKVNTDENRELAIKYQVMHIPTMVLIKNGKVIERMEGVKPKAILAQKIETVI
ncbi:thioredoxin [Candidatus Epulonipiscium fishelsonii]|uniref:Thioredoxin n=1 Tax=Candidatus Epulonipiscium fishelsonii TaxID=77094 RepID=A0ACC8X8M9_9FIRM|nr:thioredoxin [Epulopiscium sp. SCG-B11WGA-EpuloA1]ONI43080.1 thioredoxin [Epulopiscium sp. SCG-B05WGA-EpuloA1]